MKAVLINPENGEQVIIHFRSVRTSIQQGEVVIALLYAQDTFKGINEQFGTSFNTESSFYCNTNCTIHIFDK